VTINSRVAEWETAPLVPVTVNGYVPGATFPATNIVSVGDEVPPAEVSMSLGPLKEAVTPAGAENVRDTGEAKLFNEVTYRFRLPDAP
jgi:hypothetical protein